jgi:hypothetical protein
MMFKFPKYIAVAVCVLGFVSASMAQKPADKTAEQAKLQSSNPAASSPAYAELLLKKTELQSELEALVLEYTEEFPKVKELRYVQGLLDRDIVRISKVKPAESGKLTLALGKLMLRRIELETDMWKLQNNYKDEHPDVKRARRKVEIFESAISQILT